GGIADYATDPALASWVDATLVWSALATYHALVRPLSTAERAAYYEEAKAFALLFGLGDGHLPRTFEHFSSYFREMVDSERIAFGEGARTLARHVLTPPLRNLLRPAGAAERIVTAALLPSRLR